jgi:hypothetical protein
MGFFILLGLFEDIQLVAKIYFEENKATTWYTSEIFFPLALQPSFGPWPTSMKLSVPLRFTTS